jgi:SAM-dependent methyltransferase
MQASARLANIAGIYMNQCRFLLRRYPALADLGLPVAAETAHDVFGIFCWHVRRLDPAAGALDEIEYLETTLAATQDLRIYEPLLIKLLNLQSARGLPHKVQPFLRGHAAAGQAIERLQQEHASHYGVHMAHYDITGGTRGASLTLYYAAQSAALRGQRILHVAPEQELRAWMRPAAQQLGFEYLTADGFAENVDYSIDLSALTLPDDSFDLIINHRVLEHVMDDAGALREMYRVLKPGGCLSISVPEALYLPRTADWRVPDPRVHSHFRTYGRDFPVQLMAVGFKVERCDWLLRQTPERLRAAKALPLLFYDAVKA